MIYKIQVSPSVISANWIVDLSKKSFKMLKGKASFNIKYRNLSGLRIEMSDFHGIFAITEL